MTTTLIDHALELLDELDAPEAVSDVRALRSRLTELGTAQAGPTEDADALRSHLVAGLADGTVSARQAGEELDELARRNEALRAGGALFADARKVVEERLHAAASAVGDGWIVALRPAVDRLVEALAKATKLTDGALVDVEAGNGTTAQRTAVESVRATLPLARRVQALADELRRVGLVPTDVLAGADLAKWTAALRWEDVTPVEGEIEARRVARGRGEDVRPLDAGQVEEVIRLHRDRGAMPALLTASEVVDRPGEGPRSVAERAERERQENGRRLAGQKRAEEYAAQLASL